jgi:pSer/pThr/pTyr-binding forkhead associated (FHA) protein
VSIGRGHDCEIRITDISVSRLHAYIKKDPLNGDFTVEDNTSKFGTLSLVRKPTMLDPTRINTFQIGRSIVELTVTLPDHHLLRQDAVWFPEL